jgi:hypothetical protein
VVVKAPTSVLAANLRGDAVVRVAAAGDVHCAPENRDAVMTAFDAIDGEADVVLLAGRVPRDGDARGRRARKPRPPRGPGR